MKKWKKMITLLVGALLLISLASGCGDSAETEIASRPDFHKQTENTEDTNPPSTIPEEEFVLVYEPDREDLPTRAEADQVIQGMTLEQVWHIMGNPQRDLGIGELSPQWDIDSGEKLSVYCEKDELGKWYSTYAEIEYPAPSMTEEEALEIAEDLIIRFQWLRAVGVCCDFTVTYDDLSGYLTEAQAEYYYGFQYRLDCCHTAEEVRAHIQRVIDPTLVKQYPDDFLVTDSAGVLSLIVVPMGATFYGDMAVTAYDGNQITATAQMMDEEGPYGTTTFVMDRVGDDFQISMFTTEIW